MSSDTVLDDILLFKEVINPASKAIIYILIVSVNFGVHQRDSKQEKRKGAKICLIGTARERINRLHLRGILKRQV